MNAIVANIQSEVLDVLRRHGVLRAFLFGSVVHGALTEQSDIDFLVEFEAGRTLLDLSGLRIDLKDVLGRDVDVLTPRSLHPKLKEKILAERIKIL